MSFITLLDDLWILTGDALEYFTDYVATCSLTIASLSLIHQIFQCKYFTSSELNNLKTDFLIISSI